MTKTQAVNMIEKYGLKIDAHRDEERTDIIYYSAFSMREGGYNGPSVIDAVLSWMYANNKED